MQAPADHISTDLPRWPTVTTTASAVALMVLVLLPCFVPTTPVRHFESDPRANFDSLSGGVLVDLGPVGVAWLQTLTAVVAMIGLAASAWAGARLNRIAVILAACGAVFAAYHATKTSARWEDWTQAGAWVSAAAAGLAAMHLGQFETARRWVVALTAAAAIPLLAESAWYVWVEHPQSVKFFETHRDELLAARGFLPGSEQAALFERRLRFADATGTFGLSNVLASVAAAMGMTSLGLAAGMRWRGGKALGLVAPLTATLAGTAALTVVFLTASKGAVLAVAAALGLVAVVWVVRRWPCLRVITPPIAVGIVALAFAAVLVRGAMGPPPPPEGGFVAGAEIEGERSLFFRTQYWTAAARIVSENPVLGSGARGFADLYPATKEPTNPETVTSTHNVFVDQVTMLGVGGWAWVGLLLWWLWRAGRTATLPSDTSESEKPTEETPPSSTVDRSVVWTAVTAAVGVFALTLWVRRSSLFLESALVWLVGIAGFVAVAAVLASGGAWRRAMAQRTALWIAATVILVHNQVEMAFFQTPAMGLLWVIIGAAGSGYGLPAQKTKGASENRKHRLVWGSLGTAGAIAVVGGMLLYASGAASHERAMAGAERALLRGDIPLAISRLDEAQSAAGLDTRALGWRVRLHAFEPMQLLFRSNRQDQAQQRVAEALAWVDQAADADSRSTAVARLRASLLSELAIELKTADSFSAAESAYQQLAKKSPYNIRDRLAWADLAATAGQDNLAKQRYAQVLELREAKYLDPADPLTPEELSRVSAALAASE